MRLKKLMLSSVLGGTMIMSLMMGCGQADSGSEAAASADGTESIQLKVWVPETEMELTKGFCEEFDENHSEYDIEFTYEAVENADSITQLKNDPEVAADVFVYPTGGVPEMIEAGLIYPITVNEDQVKSAYGANAIASCSADGILYGIPQTPNAFFMYYNKDLFTEEEVKNLDTMMAKDLGEGKYNFSTQFTNSWYAEMFFLGNGCTLFGADGTDPTECSFNNEKGLEAGQYMLDLLASGKYLEDADGVGGSAFKEGNLGAVTSGAWSAPEFREALGDKLGAVALPTAKIGSTEVQLSNFVDFKTITVKSSTAYPLCAQQLAIYMANPENCLTRYKEQGDVPVLKSLSSSQEIADDMVAKALNEQASKATNQPSIPKMGDYWDPMKALGEGIYYGDINSGNLQAQLDALVDSITGTLTN